MLDFVVHFLGHCHVHAHDATGHTPSATGAGLGRERGPRAGAPAMDAFRVDAFLVGVGFPPSGAGLSIGAI